MVNQKRRIAIKHIPGGHCITFLAFRIPENERNKRGNRIDGADTADTEIK